MCKCTGNLQSQGPVVRSTYISNFIYNEVQGSSRKQEGKSLPFQDPLVAWFRTNGRCGGTSSCSIIQRASLRRGLPVDPRERRGHVSPVERAMPGEPFDESLHRSVSSLLARKWVSRRPTYKEQCNPLPWGCNLLSCLCTARLASLGRNNFRSCSGPENVFVSVQRSPSQVEEVNIRASTSLTPWQAIGRR